MIKNNKMTIPKGWETLQLGDIADITNGKTNSQDAVNGGKYPLFDRSIFIKRSDKFLFDGEAIILPGEGAEFVPRYFVGKFDLHQRAYAIFIHKDKIYSQFLYQFLLANKNIFLQTAVGSTVKSLRLPIIKKVFVNVPSLEEQKKIAEILMSVDDGIRKTDEIIIQTEKLKKGLMQDLFTKGIGHNKFKKTKIGEVSEDWRVVTIKDAPLKLIDGDRGVNYPKLSDFTSGGYCLFLNNKNIKNDQFVFSDIQFVSREKDELLRKGKLERLDVVLTTRGTVGNVAFYNDDISFENIRINSGMLLLRAYGELNSDFLYHLMKSPFMKKRYDDVVSGSAQPQLPIRSLQQIYIPVPPEDEQEKIVEISQTIDNKISVNNRYREILIKLKKGLAQDLLSGKIIIK